MEALDVEFDIEKEAHTYFTSDDNESMIKDINNGKLSSDIGNDLVASKEENVDVGVKRKKSKQKDDINFAILEYL